MTFPALLRPALLALALFAAPSLVAAKAPPVEAAVPDQPWYPPGYRDLRIAAEGTVRTFPRDPRYLLWNGLNDRRTKTYDVIDCNLGYDLPNASESEQGWRELLALDIARMRSELAKLGYRKEIFDQPLLDHERASLAHFAQVIPRPLPPPVEVVDEFVPFTESAPIDEALEDDAYYDWLWGLDTLAERMEAARQRLQPDKPKIGYEGGCGAGEVEFSVALSPPTGRLWLINAFAFKVCERKVADPWNHQACGWNEFASGDTTTASGRYMYEARWPDGTVRRGAKVLQETEDGAAIVIRRN